MKTKFYLSTQHFMLLQKFLTYENANIKAQYGILLLIYSYNLTSGTRIFLLTFMLFWHSMFQTKQSLAFITKVMINSCQFCFTHSATILSLFFVIYFGSWRIILEPTRMLFGPKVLITQLRIILLKILSFCIFYIKKECSHVSYILRNVYQSFNRPFILFFLKIFNYKLKSRMKIIYLSFLIVCKLHFTKLNIQKILNIFFSF